MPWSVVYIDRRRILPRAVASNPQRLSTADFAARATLEA
jgi:hypothetical protein